MRSLRTSRVSGVSRRGKPGFTLIEMLVVLGIILALGLMSPLATIRFSQGSLLEAERNSYAGLLEQARGRALRDSSGASHGVHRDADGLVLFAGSSYLPGDPANERYPRASSVQVSGPDDVSFRAQTGEAVQPANLVLGNGAQSAGISVEAQGRITW